jgi:hypothetical protein
MEHYRECVRGGTIQETCHRDGTPLAWECIILMEHYWECVIGMEHYREHVRDGALQGMGHRGTLHGMCQGWNPTGNVS